MQFHSLSVFDKKKCDHFFEFLVGFGTETVAQGAQVESFRLMVGGTQDF